MKSIKDILNSKKGDKGEGAKVPETSDGAVNIDSGKPSAPNKPEKPVKVKKVKEVKTEEKREMTMKASLKTLVGYLKWIVVAAIVVILLSGVTFVQPNEVAIVLRFGKLVGDTPEKQLLQPGIHVNLPYIIDKVVRVPVKTVQDVTVNDLFAVTKIRDIVSDGYALTGDDNVLLVKSTIRYQISDPVAYAIYMKDPINSIREITVNSLIREIAAMNVDDVLTRQKQELAERIVSRTQSVANDIKLGVTFTNFEFITLEPPSEVKPEFDLVTSTYVENETILQEALTYANRVVTAATAERDSMIQQAKSYKAEKVAMAISNVAQFNGVIEEYRSNPVVVSERLYREKLENILSKVGTLRFLPGGSSNDTIVIP